MKTVVLGEPPPQLAEFLAPRRALGQDGHDEVWDGEYHVAPAAHPWHGYIDRHFGEVLAPAAKQAGLVGTTTFNLGEPDDYRVPDAGYHRGMPSTAYVATAAIVVEIVSPPRRDLGEVRVLRGARCRGDRHRRTGRGPAALVRPGRRRVVRRDRPQPPPGRDRGRDRCRHRMAVLKSERPFPDDRNGYTRIP
jgi:hypothetical protein